MVYIYKIVTIGLLIFTLFFLGIIIKQHYSIKQQYGLINKNLDINLLLIKKINNLKKENTKLKTHINKINKDSILTNYCYDYLRWQYNLVIKEEI